MNTEISIGEYQECVLGYDDAWGDYRDYGDWIDDDILEQTQAIRRGIGSGAFMNLSKKKDQPNTSSVPWESEGF